MTGAYRGMKERHRSEEKKEILSKHICICLLGIIYPFLFSHLIPHFPIKENNSSKRQK